MKKQSPFLVHSISEQHQILGLPKAVHPLISVFSFDEIDRLRYYHGDLCKGTSMKDLFAKLNLIVMKHYNETLVDKGGKFSMDTMWDQIIDVDFLRTKPEFNVPIYFVVGRCDYNAVHTLIEQYYEKVKAPRKQLIYFEKSGYNMPFTEPDKFDSLLISIAQ